jgi:hypothetical protein
MLLATILLVLGVTLLLACPLLFLFGFGAFATDSPALGIATWVLLLMALAGGGVLVIYNLAMLIVHIANWITHL